MILDTSAIIAVLFREAEAVRFTERILRADHCALSAGSYLEVALVLERLAQAEDLQRCDAFFLRAGITVAPFTPEQAQIARQAFHEFGKGRHPAGLNFGDCFAYALARVTGEPLLYKGVDFAQTDIPAAG